VTARAKARHGTIEYWNCMLQYYYKGLDPATLTNKQWADKIAYLEIIRQEELNQLDQ
jgi:hypothetical protein